MWRLYRLFCGDNLLRPIPKIQFFDTLEKEYGFEVVIYTGNYFFYRDTPIDVS